MKISVTFESRYREMYCTYCARNVHTAKSWLPSFVNEWMGRGRFQLHRRTAEHKGNRPVRPWNGGKLAPAPKIDAGAFRRRRDTT